MSTWQEPPEGWDAFGTNVDWPGPIEFSEELDADGFPRWERRMPEDASW